MRHADEGTQASLPATRLEDAPWEWLFPEFSNLRIDFLYEHETQVRQSQFTEWLELACWSMLPCGWRSNDGRPSSFFISWWFWPLCGHYIREICAIRVRKKKRLLTPSNLKLLLLFHISCVEPRKKGGPEVAFFLGYLWCRLDYFTSTFLPFRM